MRSEPVTGNLIVGRPFTHATNTCCRSARRNPGHQLRDKNAQGQPSHPTSTKHHFRSRNEMPSSIRWGNQIESVS